MKSGEGVDRTPKSKKTRALIAYLALMEDGSASRDTLAGLVWSTRGKKQARDSLRQAIAQVRRELAIVGAEHILSAERAEVSLDLGSLWIDARQVASIVESDDPSGLSQLLTLYSGPLLQSLEINDPVFEEWVEQERGDIARKVEIALEKLLNRKIKDQDFEQAEEVAHRLQALDKFNESYHRALMQVYCGKGDFGKAVRQYRTLAAILDEELKVEPSAETKALFEVIQNQEAQPARPRHDQVATTFGPRLHFVEASLAVLPFEDMSGEAKTDPFIESITHDVVSALTRFRWLAVVGPQATRIFLRQRADLLEIGRALQVEYLLDGNVLRRGSRARIAVQLISCSTAETIWADYVMCDVDDIFTSLDHVAALVAGRMESQIRFVETNIAQGRSAEDLEPRKSAMRAIPLIYKMTPASLQEAERVLANAIENEPNWTPAYTWRAFWQLVPFGQIWADDLRMELERIDWSTRVAVEQDPYDIYALALRGHAEAFVFHRFDRALEHFDRCLSLNPNFAFGLGFSAFTYCYIGEAEKALRQLHRCRALCPFDPYPHFFDAAFCMAYTITGQHELAVQYGRRAIGHNPSDLAAYRPLVSSLGHLGLVQEGASHLSNLARQGSNFTIQWLRENYPPLGEGQINRYIEGLRRVGVPET